MVFVQAGDLTNLLSNLVKPLDGTIIKAVGRSVAKILMLSEVAVADYLQSPSKFVAQQRYVSFIFFSNKYEQVGSSELV